MPDVVKFLGSDMAIVELHAILLLCEQTGFLLSGCPRTEPCRRLSWRPQQVPARTQASSTPWSSVSERPSEPKDVPWVVLPDTGSETTGERRRNQGSLGFLQGPPGSTRRQVIPGVTSEFQLRNTWQAHARARH